MLHKTKALLDAVLSRAFKYFNTDQTVTNGVAEMNNVHTGNVGSYAKEAFEKWRVITAIYAQFIGWIYKSTY